MKRKYYWPEHEAAYREIEHDGKTAWDELHGSAGFDDFSSRGFLEQAVDMLTFQPSETSVLEYGCGTGPASCLLASRGFAVDAIDLIPRAIKLARRIAAERGLSINFQVQDICALAATSPVKQYDLIVDSYCLQSVVLDEDRALLFAAVRSRLKPEGYYLISTAMYEPERGYGEGIYDQRTGIVYSRMGGEADRLRDAGGAVLINGIWHLPHRRHLKPEVLARELEQAGFRVLHQGGPSGGNVVCRHASTTIATA